MRERDVVYNLYKTYILIKGVILQAADFDECLIIFIYYFIYINYNQPAFSIIIKRKEKIMKFILILELMLPISIDISKNANNFFLITVITIIFITFHNC